MKKHVGGPNAGQKLDALELSKVEAHLGNSFVRLSAVDRKRAMRALGEFVFGKNSSFAYWDLWSKAEMKTCYLRLKPISQEMANDLRRWASEHLKAGHNNRLALKCLIDELVVRHWIEEPESDFEG
jgi:hypothetical protein